MLNHATVERLHQMRLSGMAEAFKTQLGSPESQGLSFEERFGMVVDAEWTLRQNKRLARLLKEARLRIPAAPEDIDFRSPRGLDKSLVRALLSGDWIRNGRNLIVTGPTGVGKTFLACAFGNAACRQGQRVRYHRVPRLLQELELAKADGSYAAVLGQLGRIELLILDDWGLAPPSATGARDLLELVDERSLARSTLIASQLPIDNWHASLPDPTVADAILDRLVHSAYKIQLEGESMRKVIPARTSNEPSE